MLPPLTTPAFSEMSREIISLALSSLDLPPGVRQGALIDGHPTLGKSTMVVEIARRYEKLLRTRMQRRGDEGFDNEFIPVCYITLSSNETPKSLNIKLLEFYGEPYSDASSEAMLTTKAAKCANESGTSLVVIDDIHFLNPRVRSGLTVSQHLKGLASAIYGTFCYAGVDLVKTGLLYEGSQEHEAQKKQTQRRFKDFSLVPFEKGDENLKKLLAALETQLALLKGQSGDLVGLTDYVHDRTNGFLGPITALVRETALLAIEEKQERISRSLMERVTLDHASERHSHSVQKAGS